MSLNLRRSRSFSLLDRWSVDLLRWNGQEPFYVFRRSSSFVISNRRIKHYRYCKGRIIYSEYHDCSGEMVRLFYLATICSLLLGEIPYASARWNPVKKWAGGFIKQGSNAVTQTVSTIANDVIPEMGKLAEAIQNSRPVIAISPETFIEAERLMFVATAIVDGYCVLFLMLLIAFLLVTLPPDKVATCLLYLWSACAVSTYLGGRNSRVFSILYVSTLPSTPVLFVIIGKHKIVKFGVLIAIAALSLYCTMSFIV